MEQVDMEEQTKLVKFIVELNKLTQNNKIQWIQEFVQRLVPEIFPKSVYSAEYLNRKLRVTEDGIKKIYGLGSNAGITIEILNQDNKTELRLENITGLSDLLSTIQDSILDSQSFINEILLSDSSKDSVTSPPPKTP